MGLRSWLFGENKSTVAETPDEDPRGSGGEDVAVREADGIQATDVAIATYEVDPEAFLHPAAAVNSAKGVFCRDDGVDYEDAVARGYDTDLGYIVVVLKESTGGGDG